MLADYLRRAAARGTIDLGARRFHRRGAVLDRDDRGRNVRLARRRRCGSSPPTSIPTCCASRAAGVYPERAASRSSTAERSCKRILPARHRRQRGHGARAPRIARAGDIPAAQPARRALWPVTRPLRRDLLPQRDDLFRQAHAATRSSSALRRCCSRTACCSPVIPRDFTTSRDRFAAARQDGIR